MAKKEGKMIIKDDVIVCPICGFEGVGQSMNPKNNTRGFQISMKFSGECGHNWTSSIRFHKGQMLVDTHIGVDNSNNENMQDISDIWRD